MIKNLEKLINFARRSLRDDVSAILEETQEELARSSLALHSHKVIIKKTQSYSGDGVNYDFALPTSWHDGYSVIESIEYPAGSQFPEILDVDKYIIYDNGTVKKIRFLNNTPASNEIFLVTYTYLLLSDNDINALNDHDLLGISFLLASMLATTMASVYAQSSNDVVEGESTDFSDLVNVYLKISKELKDRYLVYFGLTDKSGATSVVSRSIPLFDGSYSFFHSLDHN